MDLPVRFLGACLGLGAQIRTCEKGPAALFPEIEHLYPTTEGTVLSRIHEFNLRLAARISTTLQEGRFPLILGGDHSIAVGTWNGVCQAMRSPTWPRRGGEVPGPLGLIWIDAHMDGHTLQTTPSGAFHGMPLAGLLGYGEPEFAQLLQAKPVLASENLVLIGVRSFEEGEAALFKKLQVKIYFIDEVKQRGLKTVVEEAISQIRAPHVGLSLDLDSIDPFDAPGVGSPEPNGLSANDLLAALPLFKNRLIAFELVEYNPDLDKQNKTRELVYEIIDSVLESDCKNRGACLRSDCSNQTQEMVPC